MRILKRGHELDSTIPLCQRRIFGPGREPAGTQREREERRVPAGSGLEPYVELSSFLHRLVATQGDTLNDPML